MQDQALFEKKWHAFPMPDSALCKWARVLTTYLIDWTIAPKGVVNIALIKDVNNTLLQIRMHSPGGPTMFSQAPQQQYLSFEGRTTSPKSGEAFKQPEASGPI